MPSERTHMRLTIDIDTDQLTDRDRRVLAALIGDDTGPLVLPRFPGTDNAAPATPASPLPLPVPAPADFAAKLGEAVQQFSPRGSGSEARLPFAQQAGVRTSSTMPDDDEPAEVVDASDITGEPAEVVDAGELEARDDGLVHTRWGRPEDRAPEPSDESEHDAIIWARGGITVPRSLVEEQPPPDPGALVREAVLRQPLTAPVRHTSP
jgi:hypothetical protein